MKKIIFSAVCSSLVLMACNNSEKKIEGKSLKSAKDSASYMLGLNQAMQLKQYGIKEVNKDLYLSGLLEGLKNDSGFAVDIAQSQMMFDNYIAELEKEISKTNLIASDKFLAEIAKKPNVQKLNAGVLVEKIKDGVGEDAGISDSASFHFTLSTNVEQNLLDTRVSGYPFPMTNIMGINYATGLSDAILAMKTGGEYNVYIPFATANSPAMKRYNVKPGQVIVFKIIDINIKKPI